MEYEATSSNGANKPSEKLVYNIIEVNDRSSGDWNGTIDDSGIKGSGKIHSRILYDSLQELPAPPATNN